MAAVNAIPVRAQDGELLEELIFRHYGRQNDTLVKLVREDLRNHHLLRPGVSIVLNMSIEVWCPDAPLNEAQRVRPHSDNMWD